MYYFGGYGRRTKRKAQENMIRDCGQGYKSYALRTERWYGSS